MNPPNADLSIYEDGELLESGGATTLFIDPGPVHRKVRRTSRRTARRVDRRQDRRD